MSAWSRRLQAGTYFRVNPDQTVGVKLLNATALQNAQFVYAQVPTSLPHMMPAASAERSGDVIMRSRDAYKAGLQGQCLVSGESPKHKHLLVTLLKRIRGPQFVHARVPHALKPHDAGAAARAPADASAARDAFRRVHPVFG
jgi:hypothetical protein